MGNAQSSRSCSLFNQSSTSEKPNECNDADVSVDCSSSQSDLPSNDSFERRIGITTTTSDLDDRNNRNNNIKTKQKQKQWKNAFKQNTPEFIKFELENMPAYKLYPHLCEKAYEILQKWHKEFPESIWSRTVKGDRVAKEFNESAPVIARVLEYIDSEFEKPENEEERITIVDLCSGYGYLGMFLSELLDESKVRKIYLIDKEFPQVGKKAKENRMSNAHIVGVGADEDDDAQVESWRPNYRIPIFIRKVDLKGCDQVQSMQTHLFGETKFAKSPVIILGIHLCGTLSFKACEMFNANANAFKLILKPCCLPNWEIVNAYKYHTFNTPEHHFGPFGSQKFIVKTRDVCARGKWKKNKWIGPPRSSLEPKFNVWTETLCKSIEDRGVVKNVQKIEIQTDGGFQNAYIFADRIKTSEEPITTSDWTRGKRAYPTWNGGEAFAWHPDGRGRGTHIKKVVA